MLLCQQKATFQLKMRAVWERPSLDPRPIVTRCACYIPTIMIYEDGSSGETDVVYSPWSNELSAQSESYNKAEESE